MRIKLNGECIEKATKLFSHQNDWNTKNQRTRNNDLTNLEIESQKAKIYNTLSQLLDEIDNVTVYDLKIDSIKRPLDLLFYQRFKRIIKKWNHKFHLDIQLERLRTI